MEIEIESLEELDPQKIYHISLKPDVGSEEINAFASAVKAAGLRALITRSGIKFELFADMFKNLSEESKARLRSEINPLDHEQTK